MRRQYTGLRFGGPITPMVKRLMIINGGIFLLQLIVGLFAPGRIEYFFGLHHIGLLHRFMIWQPFTYMFLHGSFLHIFFNLIWFIILGNQIEFRIGSVRYASLLLLLGILPNVAQYLMSGPFFMGLSGIVCGMAAFIWARQQVAPWEGYLLQKFTLIFLAVFVLGLLALQTVFFFLESSGIVSNTIGIANTAHITGALVGYLMGRMPLYKIRNIG